MKGLGVSRGCLGEEVINGTRTGTLALWLRSDSIEPTPGQGPPQPPGVPGGGDCSWPLDPVPGSN